VRELLKRSLVWAAPLELVSLITLGMGLIAGEALDFVSGWAVVPIQIAFGLHLPAVRFWAAGQLPMPFVVLNGYLVLVVLVILATSTYRAIKWWLARP
jgi:hypothetical protein